MKFSSFYEFKKGIVAVAAVWGNTVIVRFFLELARIPIEKGQFCIITDFRLEELTRDQLWINKDTLAAVI